MALIRPRSVTEGLKVPETEIGNVAAGYFARGDSYGTSLYGFNLFGASNTWSQKQTFGQFQSTGGDQPPSLTFSADVGILVASGTGTYPGNATIDGSQNIVGTSLKRTSTGETNVSGLSNYGGLVIAYAGSTAAGTVDIKQGTAAFGSIFSGWALCEYAGDATITLGDLTDAKCSIAAAYAKPGGSYDHNIKINGSYSFMSAGTNGTGYVDTKIKAYASSVSISSSAISGSYAYTDVTASTKSSSVNGYIVANRSGTNSYVDIGAAGSLVAFSARSTGVTAGVINVDVGSIGGLSCFYMKPRSSAQNAYFTNDGKGSGFIGYLRRGSVDITSTARGSMVIGQVGNNTGSQFGNITMSGSNSIIVGRAASTNDITVTGIGSGAFGLSNTGDIDATANNCWQFGPGQNAEADCMAIGHGPRLFGKVDDAPTTPRPGDIYVLTYNGYRYAYLVSSDGAGGYYGIKQVYVP